MTKPSRSSYLYFVLIILELILTIIITTTTQSSSAALTISPRALKKENPPIIEDSLYEDGGVWLRGPLIGHGGFGTVHLAHFPTLFFPTSPPKRYRNFPPFVAVKSNRTLSYYTLIREILVYRKIGNSPHIIRYFGNDVTASASNRYHLTYNIFLEFASGGTVFDMIRNSSDLGLAESDVREITRSVVGGLKHIHEAGYVHCDIKPGNVFLVKELGGDFVAKIGDVGVAKRANSGSKKDYVKGTPLFMAPESLRDGIQEKESDIWSLGCLVFSMFTGRFRWDSEQGPSIQYLEDMRDRITEEGVDFVRQCLRVDPAERPTAAALLGHPFLKGMGSDVDRKLPQLQGLDVYRFSKEEEENYEEIFFDVARQLAFSYI